VILLKAGPLYMVRKTSDFDRWREKVKQISDKGEVIRIPEWECGVGDSLGMGMPSPPH
jgi:hypothetical protein